MAQENTVTKMETPAEKLARLERENEALKAQVASAGKRGLTMKVGQSGGVSVYGLGRFPVTLYKEQWQRLFGAILEIQAFIREHDSELSVKAPK